MISNRKYWFLNIKPSALSSLSLFPSLSSSLWSDVGGDSEFWWCYENVHDDDDNGGAADKNSDDKW